MYRLRNEACVASAKGKAKRKGVGGGGERKNGSGGLGRREGKLAQRQRERGKPKRLRDSLSKFRTAVSIYRKIPIISPGLIFGQKAFSPNFSWGGGGGVILGGAYTWTNICVLKTLFFVQAIVFF